MADFEVVTSTATLNKCSVQTNPGGQQHYMLKPAYPISNHLNTKVTEIKLTLKKRYTLDAHVNKPWLHKASPD